MRSGRTAGRGLACVLLLSSLLAGCVQPVGPARSFDDYRHKAKDTAETVLSSVETARLASRVTADDGAFPPYVSVLLSNVESDASAAQTTFDGIQPPDHSSDILRHRLDELLSTALDVLATARIAARRADLDAVARLEPRLTRVGRDLDRFVQANG